MTTWAKDNVASASWEAESTILYLLTEDDENLLDETGDLILLDRGQLAAWTKDSVASASWTKKTIT